MRVLAIALLSASFAISASGEDKQPENKKAPEEPKIAEFAGVWKNDALEVAGRNFEAAELTIQADGKTKASYKEKKGDKLTPGTAEFVIKLVKVEVGKKEQTITHIEDFLGVEWQQLRLASPDKLIAIAIIDEKGGGVKFVEYAFTRVPEKKK